MSVQHLTTLWYSITIYHLSSCGSRLHTLFFILRRKSTAVQYSWRNCIFQDLQTFNGDTPQGKCTSSCMMLQRWRHLPNQLALWKPFFGSVHLFCCNQGTIYMYMNVYVLLAIVHPTRCGMHPPKPSTTHVPGIQDALYATTIVCGNQLSKKHLRMQDSTGPIALYLQISVHVCFFTLLTTLLFEWIRSYVYHQLPHGFAGLQNYCSAVLSSPHNNWYLTSRLAFLGQ